MGTKRRRHDPDARYAMLPLPLMKHAAVLTLDHAAFRVLAVFAAQYDGRNNGTLRASYAYMESEWGIKSKDTIYRARNELISRGLILVAREGIRMKKIPSLFAISWRDINNWGGWPCDTPKPAPHGYRDWVPSDPNTTRQSGHTQKISHPTIGPTAPDGRAHEPHLRPDHVN